MAALIPDEKCLVLKKQNLFLESSKTQQGNIQDQWRHPKLMEHIEAKMLNRIGSSIVGTSKKNHRVFFQTTTNIENS